MRASVPPSEAARLEALAQYEILDTAPEHALDELAELAAHLTSAPIALISLVDEKRQWFKARVGTELTETPRALSICSHTLEASDLVVIPDASADDRFAQLPVVTGDPHVRFYAGVPLLTPEGHAIGTLCVIDQEARTLDPSQRLSLRLIARQVMALLEMRRAVAQLRKSHEAEREATRNIERMLDEAPVGYYTIDAQAVIRSINHTMLGWLGYTEPEVVDRLRIIELLHPEDRKNFAPSFAVLQRDGHMTRDVVYYRKDGSALQGILHARASYDEQGKFRACRSVVVEAAESRNREAVLAELAQRHAAEVEDLRARCRAESKRADEAQAELQKRDYDLDLLLAATSLGIWHWDLTSGKITRRGPIEKIFGAAQEMYKGTIDGLIALIHPDDLLEFRTAVERARKEKNLYEHEFRVVAADGSFRWLQGKGRFTYDAAGLPITMEGIVLDVTQRREAQAALDKAGRRIAAILESVTDGFVSLDRNWRYTYVNRRAGELLGRPAETLVGKHIWTEFPEGLGQPFHLAYERALREQLPIAIESFYPPWDRWFENRIYPWPDGLAIFFQDITERKRTEEQMRSTVGQLRALSARLQTVRDEENARVAREIHDGMGQQLTALKLDLASFARKMPSDEKIQEMLGLVDVLVGSVRRISTELRPAVLDDLGLPAAVEWLGEDFERRSGITTSVHVPERSVKLPREAANALFRVAQEALTNVARHAGASRVEIDVAESSTQIELTVHDDGAGIKPDALSDRRSMGLVGMRERMQAVGGMVDIECGKTGGTTVKARVPIEARSA